MAKYPQSVDFGVADPLQLIRQVRHLLRKNGMDIGLLLIHPRTLAEISKEAENIQAVQLNFDQRDGNEGTIYKVPFKQTVDINA